MDEKERLVALEERAKSNTKRLDEHDEQIKELSNVYVALTKVDDKVTNVETDVSEIKSDLKEIKEKPLKDYEDSKKQVRNTVFAFLIGIICTFIAIKLGLGQYL